jgi:hypothetical protein
MTRTASNRHYSLFTSICLPSKYTPEVDPEREMSSNYLFYSVIICCNATRSLATSS